MPPEDLLARARRQADAGDLEAALASCEADVARSGPSAAAYSLERWLSVVDRDRVLVVSSDRFYKRTDEVYQEVLRFLGLESWRPPVYENFSYAGERPTIPPMPSETRSLLERELASEIEAMRRLEESSPAVA